MTEQRINQYINWLKDALYDMQCGNLGSGEILIQETIKALEETEDN